MKMVLNTWILVSWCRNFIHIPILILTIFDRWMLFPWLPKPTRWHLKKWAISSDKSWIKLFKPKFASMSSRTTKHWVKIIYLKKIKVSRPLKVLNDTRLILWSKLYIQSTLNTDYLLWHTQLIMCAVKY